MFIVPISGMEPISGVARGGQVQQNIGAEGGIPFKNMLSEAIENMQQLQEVSAKDAYELAMGRSDDLHNVMINSLAATTAVEMTVQLTSRAVGAYKEIMQMQV